MKNLLFVMLLADHAARRNPEIGSTKGVFCLQFEIGAGDTCESDDDDDKWHHFTCQLSVCALFFDGICVKTAVEAGKWEKKALHEAAQYSHRLPPASSNKAFFLLLGVREGWSWRGKKLGVSQSGAASSTISGHFSH